MELEFSPIQEQEIKKIISWFKGPKKDKPFYYLAGYAGTGKTTLAKYIEKELGVTVLYGAYTGKAALVMMKNGCKGASTIHSMIYKPVVNKKTGEVSYSLNLESIIDTADLIIIDECSMVDQRMGEDLLFFGKPILVLGDPAQLPPINGSGYFTNGIPDGMLTEIHRQAAGNPIIELATKVRNKETLELGRYGSSKVTNKFLKDEVFGADQFICGLNKTRMTMNHKFRDYYGFKGKYPEKNERLICLKNDKDTGMLNGELYTATADAVDKTRDFVNLKIASVDRYTSEKEVKSLKFCYDPSIPKPDWKLLKGKHELTYGYALTAHKSQGSQWETTYIYNESEVFGDNWWRWLYTAITRAEESTTIYV